MARRLLVVQDFCLTQRFADDVVLAVAGRMRAFGQAVAVTAFAGFDAHALTDAKARKVQGHTLGHDADLPDWLNTLRDDTRTQAAAFAARCQAAGIACETVVTESDPAGTLLALAEGCDWAAIPRDASLSHWNERAGDHTASGDPLWCHLLLHATVPVLVGPRTPPSQADLETGGIVVGYDGSGGASRVVHSMAGLGFAPLGPIHVLSVADEEPPFLQQAENACDLLRAHGGAVTFERQGTDEDPADAILGRVRASAPLCLAIGAFGHRTWRERIFGSVTGQILERCPSAILIQR